MADFQSIVPIILIAILLWLVGLTVVFYRLLSHYKRIVSRSSKTKSHDLMGLLDSIMKKEDNVLSELKSVRGEIDRLDKRLTKPVQKIGIVRFNPFREIGGDHSFSLSLLSQDDDGFILTGLHTRDRTRVYLKPVHAGVAKFELSKEEEKSLEKAKKIKL